MDEQNRIPMTPPGSDDSLEGDYANSVYYVGTVWDLKILFGELSATDKDIDWHTVITVPWAQAKLMSYYLNVNIAAYEATHGMIRVPDGMLPPVPPPLAESDRDNPSIKALVKYINETREKFIAEQKKS